MTSFMKSRRGVLVAALIAVGLSLVIATARAQDRINGNQGGNGIPQQVDELRAQLAEARAAIQQLQAALDAEQAARLAEQDRLRDAIGTIRLPQYLIDNGGQEPPSEISDVFER
jgi:hypothetical protein